MTSTMPLLEGVAPSEASARSWQSYLVNALVRARMRPHALNPIDPAWVRRQMGRPRAPRRWMVRATGSIVHMTPPTGNWPGGDVVSCPNVLPTSPVILYLHGGGYFACSPETHRPLVASLARRVQGTVYAPAYRLAPEHVFPAALDDARAAYRYLLEDCGIGAERIVVAGDSAGGGLALALTLALKDQGEPLPSCVVAFCPWTDLAATGFSLEENSDCCAMFAGDTIRRASTIYVGDADPRHPYLSPLYGNYDGFPPLLLHASHDEVLRDDMVRVANRAREARVQVSARLWHGVPHVWQFFPAVLPEARESLNHATEFIARHVAIGDAAHVSALTY